MSRYRVTTPVPDFTGVVGNCAFSNGAYEGPVQAGPLAYFQGAGYTVEQLDVPAEEPAAEPAVVEDGGSPEPPPLPAKSANKPEWVAAAVARGIDPANAEAATKEQLIELLENPVAQTGGTSTQEQTA